MSASKAMSHLGVEELVPALALGCLDRKERQAAEKHVESCPSCQASLLRYEEVVNLLVLAAPGRQPPAELKKRILAGLASPRVTRRSAHGRRFHGRFSGFWATPRLAPVWAVAAVLVVAVLAGFTGLLWRQVRHLEARTEQLSSQIVALESTESSPDAQGLIIFSRGEQRATLVVGGLQTLAPEKQYQLWLLRDGQRTNGGVFSVSANGFGVLVVEAPEPLGSYQAFGVTVEPAGGSPGPTGPKVLGGRI